jgi:hypothetical protein
VGRALRLLVAFVGATATARLALHEWAPGYDIRRSWVVALVVLLAALAVLEPIAVVVRRSVDPLTEKDKAALDILVKAALVQVIDHCRADYKRTAVNVYLVRRTWSRPIQREQLRVFRLRLAASPSASSIRWTKGKGLIGLVWATQSEQAVNIQSLYRSIPQPCSPAVWDQQPEEVRLGMSYAEYVQVAGYGVIVGVPINDRTGRYRGCVSMDTPEDYDDRVYEIEVTSALQFVANTVAAWL